MSGLTEALEFIFNWMMQNMPNHPALMRKGLSRDVIEAKIQELPFYLPEEIYELYEWRNGGVNPFLPHPDAWDLANYFSLEEAINIPNDVVEQKKPLYPSLTSMMENLAEELENKKNYGSSLHSMLNL